MNSSLRKLFTATLAVLAFCYTSSVFSQGHGYDRSVTHHPKFVYENQGFELEFLSRDFFSELSTPSSYLVDSNNIAVFYQNDSHLITNISPTPPSFDIIVVQEISGLPAGEYTVYAVPYAAAEPPMEYDFADTHLSPRGTITVLPGSFDLNVGLGSPRAREVVGGFGVIRGWACYSKEFDTIPASIGKISYQVDNRAIQPVPYGSSRGDVTERCFGVKNTGFAAQINWDRFPPGEHTFRLFIDGEEVVNRNITVSGIEESLL